MSNFNISAEVCERLEIKGISTLYGIQAQTFQTVLDGKDLVGRARTGCGKTLAFVLPIIEAINKENPLPANGRRIQDVAPSSLSLPPRVSSRNRCMLTSSTSAPRSSSTLSVCTAARRAANRSARFAQDAILSLALPDG